MWKKSKEANTESQVRNTNKYKNIRKYFTLSQKIVILITMVVFIALLPSALFTTQRVAQVIYDRVSINAVSINNILCNSDIIIDGLVKTDNSDDGLMASYVNEVDNSDEAGVAIYDKNFNLRVFYNPGKLADFKRSSLELTQKYSVQDKIDWRENYAIPNRAFGYVKDADDKIVGYVVTGYSDDVLKNSAIDSIIFLLIMTAFGLSVGIFGAIYLGVVALLPIVAGNVMPSVRNLAIGGTSVIIVVGVALETVKALENQMLMRQYKGFLE